MDIFPKTSFFTFCQGYLVGGDFFMNITQVDGNIIPESLPVPTDGEMQNEYDFILAEKLTGKLLEKGLITEEEYGLIMLKNREKFKPLISRITA